ncbi:uncharacterized protein LOC143153287 isoform X2 [Ptiloglossa arizonensis]|uniref:uncharacterized protein LOC143153287 isoform X2 n=1 Tax=Ptiloglossa arizonensis TaxID=3350558 RepID=UPI003FA112BF
MATSASHNTDPRNSDESILATPPVLPSYCILAMDHRHRPLQRMELIVTKLRRKSVERGGGLSSEELWLVYAPRGEILTSLRANHVPRGESFLKVCQTGSTLKQQQFPNCNIPFSEISRVGSRPTVYQVTISEIIQSFLWQLPARSERDSVLATSRTVIAAP